MTKRYNNHVNVRLDENLKRNFEAFCDDCEMTVSGAVNLLVRNTIKRRKIPFQVRTKATEAKGIHEGGEKQNVRISVRIDKENREEFKIVCEEIGIPVSRIIKVFMMYCVKNGKLPF